jgi:hypothetical protein
MQKIDIINNSGRNNFYKNLLNYEVNCEDDYKSSSSSSSSSSTSEEEYGIIAKYELSPEGVIVKKVIISPEEGIDLEGLALAEELVSSEEEDTIEAGVEEKISNGEVSYEGLELINTFINVVTGFVVYLFISSYDLYKTISGISIIRGYCGLSVNTPISRYELFTKNVVDYKNFRFKTFKRVKVAKVFNFMKLSYIRYVKFSYNFKKKWSLFSYFNDLLRYNLKRSYPFVVVLRKKIKLYNKIFKASNNPFFVRYLKNIHKLIRLNKKYSTKRVKFRGSIRRVKFKPGYIIMWKKARKNFQLIMGLKFKYQHRLTKFILIKKQGSYKTFFNNFSSLSFILKKLNFFKSQTSFQFLFDLKLILVNGLMVPNINFFVIKNDLISLIIFFNFYIFFYIDKFSYTLKRLKIRKWFRYTFKRHKVQFFKTRKGGFSKKYAHYFDFYSDTSFVFEVDYISLTAVYILNPSLFQELYKKRFSFNPINIYNMYNWKYIN